MLVAPHSTRLHNISPAHCCFGQKICVDLDIPLRLEVWVGRGAHPLFLETVLPKSLIPCKVRATLPAKLLCVHLVGNT